ncbi:hypothetical protein BMETH_1104_1 [methanotrophic bacterial endosymbiont of Bathymodiolus sp.]|nr:hypothetical protein BMETH_1104_1 [methanotrophic bacterial endosymbiont of Bathymodiolus sp.]
MGLLATKLSAFSMTPVTVRWIYVRCGRSSGSTRLTWVLEPSPCSFRVSPL